MPDDIGVVDLTAGGLFTAGRIAHLDIGNLVPGVVQGSQQMAFLYLHVVKIEEYFHAGATHRLGQRVGLRDSMQKHIGVIDAVIHRFHDHHQAVWFVDFGNALEQVDGVGGLKIPGQTRVGGTQHVVNKLRVHAFGNLYRCPHVGQHRFAQTGVTPGKRYIFEGDRSHKLPKVHPQALYGLADALLLGHWPIAEHRIFPRPEALIVAPFDFVDRIGRS